MPQVADELPVISDDIEQPIRIRADFDEVITLGGMELHLLAGQAELTQGSVTMSARRMVIASSSQGGSFDVRAYGEDVVFRNQDGQRSPASRTIRLQATTAPVFLVPQGTVAASPENPLLQRAVPRLFPGEPSATTRTAMQVTPESAFPATAIPFAGRQAQATRRIRFLPRSSQPFSVDTFISRDTVPEEQVIVITGGVNLLIEGLEFDNSGQQISPGVIDISADRIVAWTQTIEDGRLQSGTEFVHPAETRFQVYLEGNIVIRHKQNTITATHAFFDVNNDRALMLNAELRAVVPTPQVVFRVRAERMRQLSRDRFHAQNAWATTSPYGEPGYRLQATDIFVEPGMAVPFTEVDQITGQQVLVWRESTWVTSENNRLIVGNTPLFWLPRISGPAEDPGIPIRRATVNQDSIFGLQIRTVWDLTRVLGLRKQPGTDLNLLANYMSERGPGVGSSAKYSGANPLGAYEGNGTLYYQYDSGTDNLGRDRRRLEPESEHRGEATWRHRQRLPDGAIIFGEIGFLSDRNYLEQYDETRFDTDKDVETLLGIRQDLGAWSGQLWARPQLYQFEANTQWLPRADGYSFSQPLLGGLAYWSSHSSVGYADSNTMEPPSDPNDPFTPLGLPYTFNGSGTVAMTRHEVDAPFMLGPVNVDPFVIGEAAWWEEGLAADSVDRYLLTAGVRARLSASRVMPFVNSDLLNLRGLAHKHETILEYSHTDASRGISEIPQYNEIDENSQERFRTRYTNQIFPGVIPAEFNPRNYAIRQGAGLWTSVPWHEMADDQQLLRLSFRNRLQTKAGPLNAQRTRDWVVWESGLSYFPDSARDNFGEDIGLIYNNFRWNVSDRTSLLADSMRDVFDNSQDIWSVGVLSQRSTRGSVYLSYRQVDVGSFLDSRIVTGSYSYQMSPKWISTAAYAYDVAENASRGSSVTLSRVGLDWILHLGLGFDFSKDNVGLGISLEPRLGPPTASNLGYLMGIGR